MTENACMNLRRTPLLLFMEQAPVPVDWPKRVGPPFGVMRKTAYPAGNLGKYDDDWTPVRGGEKYADAQRWMFLKRIKSKRGIKTEKSGKKSVRSKKGIK